MHYKNNDQIVTKDQKCTKTRSDNLILHNTTTECNLLVQWKDVTEKGFTFKLLKESEPFEVAQFVKAGNIEDKPEFCLWVLIP